MQFAPVDDLVAAIGRGEMILLVDNEARENEGDLVVAADLVTPEQIGFLAIQGRGLICAPVAPEIADRLGLPPMTAQPDDPDECAFTISVDARHNTTTGISAYDRAHTARILADPSTRPVDLKRPGHLFPLRAVAGGVLERAGHTEAAIDLARLAGRAPAAVICEVMNDDGRMSLLPELMAFAERERLLLGRIEDLIAYRKEHALPRPAAAELRLMSTAELPTPHGVFQIHVFEDAQRQEIVALTLGEVATTESPPCPPHGSTQAC